MRSILGLATVFCLVFAGAANADHGHGRPRGGGVVVRDHRAPAAIVVRDHRGERAIVRDHHGPRVTHVRVTNGRYVFPGGVVRVYKRPVIRTHYYNVRVRPPLIVESYDPVPGYVWVAGSWTWGGAEWVWTPGSWQVAEPAAPVVQGGVSISAGISIH